MSNATSHVGPIIFGHPVARAQLETHGEVVTFRTADRTTGATWWRETRTGPKRGDCTVECLGALDESFPLDQLPNEYVELSGFDSAAAWDDAITDVNGSRTDGYLYRVTER
ncbi:hypothetical protein [Halomarina oriensis]|uniref:ASCH domain-containing protein n=1 Tax=Halomarina oriensis TaxID=671145 RepID=A0A6B0GVC2_9EURY|nr:hypothetical protein [Halomarina oriensis]MWG36533.1 hypothetical protein [Halomarina oriensis]